MKRLACVLAALLLVLTTAGATFIGTMQWVQKHYESQMDADPVQYKIERIGALLETYFIDEYDEETLLAAAADGAAASMVTATGDRWSYYIPADQMQGYTEQLNNEYVGVGITIQETETGMEVLSVTKGGPAEEAGVLAGDVCIEVNGRKTVELGLEGAKEQVRGEEGTTVTMVFLRGEELLELMITRRSVITPVAEWEMMEERIARISIFNFDYHCAEQTLACMQEALEQGAEGFLFDVRFNPGGLKVEMVKILDELLPEGDVFRSVDYAGEEEISRSDAACLKIPMVVLVNEDSYSAAEFFAAALQEYGVAKIVGVQTSGKGNFQYTLELDDGSAVALSVGKYFTPQGKSLTDVGVMPDLVVDLDDADYSDLYYGNLKPEEDEQLQAAWQLLLEQIS